MSGLVHKVGWTQAQSMGIVHTCDHCLSPWILIWLSLFDWAKLDSALSLLWIARSFGFQLPWSPSLHGPSLFPVGHSQWSYSLSFSLVCWLLGFLLSTPFSWLVRQVWVACKSLVYKSTKHTVDSPTSIVCDSSLGIDGWLAIDYCTRTSSESLLCIPRSLEKTIFASWEILHTASGVRLFWNLLILRLSRAISSSFSGAKSQSSHSIDLSLVFASLLSPEAKRLDSRCFFFIWFVRFLPIEGPLS